MEIRRKLSLQFTLIVAIILTIAEIAIYISSEFSWREDFYNRIYTKASAVAKLQTEVKDIDPKVLELVEKNNVTVLPYDEILIYSYSGKPMFASREPSNLRVSRELLKRIHIERTVQEKQDKYRVLGFIYTGRYDRVVVVAGAIDLFGQRKLAMLRNILLIVFIAAMIIVYISGWVYSNRALRPILGVIGEVTEIDEKHLHFRVNEGNGRDEIARLAATFNQMLDRLESAFKAQRHFIANASHELRTPLAYIMGRLEVSLQRDRSGEEYKRIILSAIDDLKILNQSTNKLLLLAQSATDSPDIPFHPIRVDEIVWEARMEVMKMVSGYRVAVDFTDSDEEPEKLRIAGNDMLLKIAFINLMENGCKYSDDTTVHVRIQRENDRIQVCFIDHGIGIPGSDLEMIFEPFFRSRHNNNREGHGLGLALVRQIIHLHDGNITVKSSPGTGSEFTVNLPCLPAPARDSAVRD